MEESRFPEERPKRRLSRREFLGAALGVGGMAILSACAQTAPPSPTAAPANAAPTTGANPASATAPAAAPAVKAPSEISIGVLFPLTGTSATLGLDCKYGTDLAAEVVNNGIDVGLPLGKTPGLPNLGGAKVKLITVDHQSLPEKGQSEAERLVLQEHVVALFGTYISSVALTASQSAERLGIPMMNGDCSSPTLTARGLKYFFRTGPHDGVYVKNFFDMLDDIQKSKGIKIKTIGIVNENTLSGNDFNKNSKAMAQQRGYEVITDVLYPPGTSDVTSEVQKLKAANPDVVFQLSYTSEAVLFVKAYKLLDFNPQGTLAYGAGFTDPQFFKLLGKDAQYYISKAAWSPDIAEKKPVAKAISDMFQKKYNQVMTENSGRDFDAMITLLDAINRAGSTDPKAIQKAIVETDIPGDKSIMPWKGIKFGEDGQNIYSQSVNTQAFDGQHYTVWPFDVASKQLVWPRTKWADIK